MLDELKNYLDITFDDSDTNNKIANIFARAKSILSDFAGQTLDFEDLSDRQLLFDLCRYIYNNAFEDFKINFESEILSLTIKYQVEEAVENDTEQP